MTQEEKEELVDLFKRMVFRFGGEAYESYEYQLIKEYNLEEAL